MNYRNPIRNIHSIISSLFKNQHIMSVNISALQQAQADLSAAITKLNGDIASLKSAVDAALAKLAGIASDPTTQAAIDTVTSELQSQLAAIQASDATVTAETAAAAGA